MTNSNKVIELDESLLDWDAIAACNYIVASKTENEKIQAKIEDEEGTLAYWEARNRDHATKYLVGGQIRIDRGIREAAMAIYELKKQLT